MQNGADEFTEGIVNTKLMTAKLKTPSYVLLVDNYRRAKQDRALLPIQYIWIGQPPPPTV